MVLTKHENRSDTLGGFEVWHQHAASAESCGQPAGSTCSKKTVNKTPTVRFEDWSLSCELERGPEIRHDVITSAGGAHQSGGGCHEQDDCQTLRRSGYSFEISWNVRLIATLPHACRSVQG